MQSITPLQMGIEYIFLSSVNCANSPRHSSLTASQNLMSGSLQLCSEPQGVTVVLVISSLAMRVPSMSVSRSLLTNATRPLHTGGVGRLEASPQADAA